MVKGLSPFLIFALAALAAPGPVVLRKGVPPSIASYVVLEAVAMGLWTFLQRGEVISVSQGCKEAAGSFARDARRGDPVEGS